MSILGSLIIADAISKSNKGNSEQTGMINCSSDEAKLEKHKQYMANATEEEREQYYKNAKVKALINAIGEEKYIEYLEQEQHREENFKLIDEIGADNFNELLLLRAKNKQLEEDNKKLKEQQKVKRYIRRK